MTTTDPSSRVTVADAKARFAACVRVAEQGGILMITKHGRPVAALVPASDAEELERLRSAGPSAGLASLAGGWPHSEELVADIQKTKRGPVRRSPRLD
jgi:prevent-host-death family protein